VVKARRQALRNWIMATPRIRTATIYIAEQKRMSISCQMS
jgi:hypothetical protein